MNAFTKSVFYNFSLKYKCMKNIIKVIKINQNKKIKITIQIDKSVVI